MDQIWQKSMSQILHIPREIFRKNLYERLHKFLHLHKIWSSLSILYCKVWMQHILQTHHSQDQKVAFSQPFKAKCISEVVRIGSIIIFHLSRLWKDKFFILCDVIFLVRLQEKFDIDHFWEWKGKEHPNGFTISVGSGRVSTQTCILSTLLSFSAWKWNL